MEWRGSYDPEIHSITWLPLRKVKVTFIKDPITREIVWTLGGPQDVRADPPLLEEQPGGVCSQILVTWPPACQSCHHLAASLLCDISLSFTD